MKKRIIDMVPSEMQKLTRNEFLDGIRASEGRTVCTYVSPASPNHIENVSNIEACASFGADYINFQGFNPNELIMPGLPSKEASDDNRYVNLQMKIGNGWLVPELKKIAGRPIGATLQVPDVWGEKVQGLNAYASYNKEYFKFLVAQGYDFIVLAGLVKETLVAAVKEARSVAGEGVVIEAGTPHGPGNPNIETTPYNLREIVTPEYIEELANAGADIIDIPAIGSVPGYDINYVSKLIDVIHSHKALAAVCIAHSIEGTSKTVIERIVLDNKVAGADVFNLAAAGLYESMPLPETLQALSIAVKGKRYTYRRMCQSAQR